MHLHVCSLQIYLLEESWTELFVLAASQWPLLPSSLTSRAMKGDFDEDAIETIRAFDAIMERFRCLRVDTNEYSCLKAICLFEPGRFICCRNRAIAPKTMVNHGQIQARLWGGVHQSPFRAQ